MFVLCDGSGRRGDAVEASGWVRAVGGVEALDLDAAISVIEEHAAVAVDDCLDPDLQLERALELLLCDSSAVVAFAGERIVLDLPIRVSVRAKALHAGGEKVQPMLGAAQWPDLNISEIRFAAEVLNAYEAFAQSVS